MVFQNTCTSKPGKLRPLFKLPNPASLKPTAHLLQRALVFFVFSVDHSDFFHHSFSSLAAWLQVLVQVHVHRPHVGRPLACFGGFLSFFFFVIFPSCYCTDAGNETSP